MMNGLDKENFISKSNGFLMLIDGDLKE